MVKIRYAGRTGAIVPTRYEGWTNNAIACDIMSKALDGVNIHFDNNIKFNRFDAVGSVYEVTIKCISSRGKGAKRGASGRRTVSCCYHVWGVFFEELFRLNPEIVIVSMGSRITSQSHVGWRERCTEDNCDCEPVDDDQAIDELIAATATSREAHWNPTPIPTIVTPANRTCSTCMYSCRNTSNGVSQCPPGECLERSGLQLWMPYAPALQPTSQRRCDYTCRHNSANHEGVTCQYGCDSRYEHWEAQPPSDFVDEPNTSCSRCEHSATRTGVSCQYYENNTCLIGGTHRKFKRAVVKTCDNCEYNFNEHGEWQRCSPFVGRCSDQSKWKLRTPFVFVGAPTSRYDTPMVEQDTQVEQVVEFPMLREE